MKKPTQTVLFEGVVVGALLIVFIHISSALLVATGYTIATPAANWTSTLLAGFLFHIACEYTGVNKWYAQNYPL